MIKLTKKQKKQILESNPGVGVMVFKSGEKEITKINFYVGKDKRIRRITNTIKAPFLLPIEFYSEEEGKITAN